MMQLPFLLALASEPAPSPACRTVSRSEILVSDIAAAIPTFAALPQDLRVGYAPYPGSRRVLHGPELERIAKSQGFDLSPLPDLCFGWQTSPPREEDIV